MDQFRIRPLTEADIKRIVERCDGEVAHPDADRRAAPGSDFILGGAAIELKLLDEDGLEKIERQSKLAALFRGEGFSAPVVVLDRANLPNENKRRYDRIIEGPIKSAVASARKQLKQTRAERPETSLSILWVLNNGYTALNHDELVALVTHRTRQDTKNIDGVIVSGCYFHSDGVEHFLLWPFTYESIRTLPFTGLDAVRDAWGAFAENFMTESIVGEMSAAPTKARVVDSQFDVDGVTFVKPAPPIGGKSTFYVNGRPRKNSSGLDKCPPVALTFPGLTRDQWIAFRRALPNELGFEESYDRWLQQEQDACKKGTPLRPFLRIPVTFDSWKTWCSNKGKPRSRASLGDFANYLFQTRVQAIIARAREMRQGGFILPRYVVVLTEEIGQDMANDLSHIAKVNECLDGTSDTQPIAENLRIFHQHAVVLASAYAVRDGIDAVFWISNRRYAWA